MWLTLARVAFGEHDFLRGGVERGEEFWNEPALGRAGFARRYQVSNDCVDPGDFVHPKNHSRALAYFEFINRRARKQIAINSDSFYHLFAEIFFDNALHGLGDELQIALIRDLEFDLVPDVRKKRPGIIPDH